MMDDFAEVSYALGNFIGENSEPLLCRLEDGVVYSYGQAMLMFLGDPLLRRVSEMIDRVVESGLYNFWNSLLVQRLKLYCRKIGIFHPLDVYYSFNMYHMHPAFYLILIGWCLSAPCFMGEAMYNSVLCKRGKFLMNGLLPTKLVYLFLHKNTLPTTRERVLLPASGEWK